MISKTMQTNIIAMSWAMRQGGQDYYIITILYITDVNLLWLLQRNNDISWAPCAMAQSNTHAWFCLYAFLPTTIHALWRHFVIVIWSRTSTNFIFIRLMTLIKVTYERAYAGLASGRGYKVRVICVFKRTSLLHPKSFPRPWTGYFSLDAMLNLLKSNISIYSVFVLLWR